MKEIRLESEKGYEIIARAGTIVYTEHKNVYLVPEESIRLLDASGISYTVIRGTSLVCHSFGISSIDELRPLAATESFVNPIDEPELQYPDIDTSEPSEKKPTRKI